MTTNMPLVFIPFRLTCRYALEKCEIKPEKEKHGTSDRRTIALIRNVKKINRMVVHAAASIMLPSGCRQ